LRRQVGATHFDIDATQGYASFAFANPVDINWEAIADTADSAGYKVNAYQFIVEGTVTTAHCDLCEEDVPVIRLPDTGQEFELAGELPALGRVRLKALASGWTEGHLTLDVTESEGRAD